MFRTLPNKMLMNLKTRMWREDPYRHVAPTRKFDREGGETPTITEFTSELPENYPIKEASFGAFTDGLLRMQQLARSPYPGPADSAQAVQGTPPAAQTAQILGPKGDVTDINQRLGLDGNGEPQAHLIKMGQREYIFEMRKIPFETPIINLEDLKTRHATKQQIKKTEMALGHFLTVFSGDHHRIANIAMLKNKLIMGSADTYGDDYKEDFTGGTIPAGGVTALDWDTLKELYNKLLRNGFMQENAIGYMKGNMPVVPFYAGVETIQRLFKEEDMDIMKYDDPKSYWAVFGSGKARHGFMPVVDLFPIRAAHQADAADGPNGTEFTYPTRNKDESFGRGNEANPNYYDNSATGTAPYEVAYILPKGCYEMVFEPNSPTEWSKAKFKEQDYTGQIQWINNKTFRGANDKGVLGYYRMDLQMGPKPINPDLGFAILHLRDGVS